MGAILFIGARYLVFVSAIKLHKHEFRQAILKQDHQDIGELVIPAEELFENVNGIEWEENNKEVVINNAYYEVLSIVRQDKAYVVSIIKDDAENDLFRHFFDKHSASRKLADYLVLVFELNFSMPLQVTWQQPPEQTVIYMPAEKHKNLAGFYSKAIKPPQTDLSFQV